jgi:hypothetical protein
MHVEGAAGNLKRVAVNEVHVFVPATEEQQVGRGAFSLCRFLLKPPQLLQKAQERRQARSRPCVMWNEVKSSGTHAQNMRHQFL